MPPRARKTVAPSPSTEDAAETAATDDASPAVPDAATPEPEAEAPALAAEESGAEVVGQDQSAVEAATELPTPPALAYRWRSLSGGDAAPCRVCAPAGPPAGAGSFGCGHGQWVLVADEAH
jgi:hypothetical protein